MAARAISPGFGFTTESDCDGDGKTPASGDCNDQDAGALAPPVEVASLSLQKIIGGVRLNWQSQDETAGAATSYDLVVGDLSTLRASEGFGAASCLANQIPDTPYDDLRAEAQLGLGDYYLVRARNSCANGTYGDGSNLPDPRDEIDEVSPCP